MLPSAHPAGETSNQLHANLQPPRASAYFESRRVGRARSRAGAETLLARCLIIPRIARGWYPSRLRFTRYLRGTDVGDEAGVSGTAHHDNNGDMPLP